MDSRNSRSPTGKVLGYWPSEWAQSRGFQRDWNLDESVCLNYMQRPDDFQAMSRDYLNLTFGSDPLRRLTVDDYSAFSQVKFYDNGPHGLEPFWDQDKRLWTYDQQLDIVQPIGPISAEELLRFQRIHGTVCCYETLDFRNFVGRDLLLLP